MNKTVIVLASVFAVLSQASAFAVVRDGNPDEMYLTLRCSDPNLKDAGLNVAISYGGILPHYAAEVSESLLSGSRVLLTVPSVSLTTQGMSQVFVDDATQGEKFRLVYRPMATEEDSPVPLNSTLIFSTDSDSTSVELNCRTFSHPM